MSDDIPVTDRTAHRRLQELGSHDRRRIYRILDEGLVCHVGFAGPQGPFVLPMGYARDGDRLLLHGSVGSRLMRALAAGAPACVVVTLLDGLVVARSLFHSSMNYRSVMVFGRATVIEEDGDKRRALEALADHLLPGRRRDARGPSPEELQRTMVLALPLQEASAKVRTGPPNDDEEDVALPIWAGVVPLRQVPGEPVPAPDLERPLPPPDYARRYRRPGAAAPGDSGPATA